MSYRTQLRVVGGALTATLYMVAGLCARAATSGTGPISVMEVIAAMMAVSTAYGATVLLRALIETLREEKRRELECSDCDGTGYIIDPPVVPGDECWTCNGTGLTNGGEQ